LAARADKPPPLPPATRQKITERIEFAMQRSVDRAHWHYLHQPHSATGLKAVRRGCIAIYF
jgi:hypothetical protein